MKKILVLFTVLAVFGGAAAVVLGNLRSSDVHQQIVDRINQEAQATVLEESFGYGVLGSNSVVRFALQPVEEGEEEPLVSFRMENRIRHGAIPVAGWVGGGAGGTPIIANVKTLITPAGAKVEEGFIEGFGELPTLEIETALRSSGVGESRFHMKPLQAKSEEGEGENYDVDWKGFDGQLLYTEDFGSVVGQFQSAGLVIDSDAVGMRVGPFHWDVDYTTDPSGLHVGSTSAVFESFEFQPIMLPIPPVSIGKVELSQVSRVENGRYFADLTQTVASVDVAGGTWGPGVVNFALNDVDAPAMAELAATFEEIQEQIEAGNQDDEAFKAEVGKKLVESLPTLAAHSPQLEFSEISLGTPQGTVRGKAQIDIDGSNAEQLANPMMLIGALSAKASAEAPADLFASMVGMWASSQVESGEISVQGDHDETVSYVRDSLIHNLRKAGYVVFDGDTYRTRIDWSQGRLTINGLPVNPMELSMITAQPERGLEFPENDGFGRGNGQGQPPAEFDFGGM